MLKKKKYFDGRLFFSFSVRRLLLYVGAALGFSTATKETGAERRINKNMAVGSRLNILQSCRERGAWG